MSRGLKASSINPIVGALRFFFGTTNGNIICVAALHPFFLAALELQIIAHVSSAAKTTEKERRKKKAMTQQVADQGNVPGQPSTPGILVIAIIVLIGLG